VAALTRTNPAALEDLAKQFDEPRTLKVGFLKGATYPETGIPVGQVAAWNEFGVYRTMGEGEHGPVAWRQPPRPFFRIMIAAQSAKWPAMAAALLKANNDVDATLDVLGQEIQGRIKESINALMAPPLAQATIDKKGFDKPLIEHAIMLNAVSFEVVRG
jgi:hypothetical protein